MATTTHTGFDATQSPPDQEINKCVHCGFCLPACPTYQLWGDERDSPRGRIYLMKAAKAGRVALDTSLVRHFDACLGCMACVSACPSGVQYGPLIEATRGQIERRYTRPASDRWFRRMIFALFPFPGRLRIALAPLIVWPAIAPLARRSGLLGLLPRSVRAMLEVAPRISLRGLLASTPVHTPATSARRRHVGLLTGCVQRLAFPNVNAATVSVLAAEGCDVTAPAAQGCCGALALHSGRIDEAKQFARRTIEIFERANVDVVVVNAAGCGSSMKEYGHVFADDPVWAGRAKAFAAKVRDVSEVLDELGPSQAVRHPLALRIAYQDACHLAHAQGVRTQPRALLASIPGVTLLPIADADTCCGSAGIYNLVQPDTARQLGDRKASHIAATKPDVVASANPGCMLQIQAAAARAGHAWPLRHPIEVLDASIRQRPLAELIEP